MKVFSVLILAAVLVQGYALQCYQCLNCTTPNESFLGTCTTQPATTEKPSPTPTTITTTTPTTNNPNTQPTNEDTSPSDGGSSTSPSTDISTSDGDPSTSPSTDSSTSDALTDSSPATTTENPEENNNEANGRNIYLYRPVRSARDAENEEQYQCFVHKKEENGIEIIDRGCILDTALCKTEEGCSLCNTDKCNGSETLRNSISTIVIMLGLSLFYFK